MPDKVLVYSRFPKAQLIRFGERYELLNAAGKRLDEAFPVAELADVSAMITAGGSAVASPISSRSSGTSASQFDSAIALSS